MKFFLTRKKLKVKKSKDDNINIIIVRQSQGRYRNGHELSGNIFRSHEIWTVLTWYEVY